MKKALALLISTLCIPSVTIAEHTPCPKLKIGIIAPLSGEAASYGASTLEGAKLALKDLGCEQEITLVVEDDQGNTTRSVAAFQKLKAIDQVDLVFCATGSSAGHAIAPLAEKARLPFIPWASDSRIVQGRKFTVRGWSRGENEGQEIIRLAEKLFPEASQTFALFSSTHDWPMSVRRGIFERANHKQELFYEEFPLDTTSFKQAIIKALAKKPDYLILNFFSPLAGGRFLKELRTLNAHIPVISNQALESDDAVSSGGLTTYGVPFISTKIDESFLKQFEEYFKHRPSMAVGAAIAYDLTSAIAQMPSPSRENILEHLMNQKNIGKALITITPTTTPEDRYLAVPYTVKQRDSLGNIVEVE